MRHVELFMPDLYLVSVFDIDLEYLERRGIRGIILDLDNTLVQWNHPEPTEPLVAWLERVRAAGFRACIVSNNTSERVACFVRSLDVPGIPKAIKPRRGSFRRAMGLMGTTAADTAVVGDQIFTDILGGRRLGLFTILVHPVSGREFIGTRLVRAMEGFWLRYLQRRGRLGPAGDGADRGEL